VPNYLTTIIFSLSMKNSQELPVAQVVTTATTVASPIANSSSSPPSKRTPQHEAQIRQLSNRGIPKGLCNVLKDSSESCALRYWIVDNSGSMGSMDGKKYVQATGGNMTSVSCSRWEELADSLYWHGTTAVMLQARTEFILLNKPSDGSPKRVVLGDQNNDMNQLTRLVTSGPQGCTPLCETIKQIIGEIRTMEARLRATHKTVSLTIATDGAASDGDVAQALAPLLHLPCTVVIRLCTDDDSVINYWNKIDDDLEVYLVPMCLTLSLKTHIGASAYCFSAMFHTHLITRASTQNHVRPSFFLDMCVCYYYATDRT
jgi:hypothetical protein